MIVLGIDPGDIHVGVALWDGDQMETTELNPNSVLAWLSQELALWDRSRVEYQIVMEDFVLYPGQDKRKAWTRMKTSELIGAIKYLCSMHNHRPVMQGADIKKPTRRQLRPRGIRLVGKNTHEKDAELHAYRWLLRNGYVK